MKTKEQKALDIAIAEGWEKLEGSNGLENDYWKNKQTLLIQSTSDVIELYTIFGDKRGNGLMPIVERINKEKAFAIFITSKRIKVYHNFSPIISQIIGIKNFIYFDKRYKDKIKCDRPLIDALLDAVHFVLCENKGKKE